VAFLGFFCFDLKLSESALHRVQIFLQGIEFCSLLHDQGFDRAHLFGLSSLRRWGGDDAVGR
jgi:hypothetical protein